MVFFSVQNKVLVLGTKIETIYSSQDQPYTDVWAPQGMCLNGKLEWFNYFSFLVKPGNSNSKAVMGIRLIFQWQSFLGCTRK